MHRDAIACAVALSRVRAAAEPRIEGSGGVKENTLARATGEGVKGTARATTAERRERESDLPIGDIFQLSTFL